MIQIKFCNALYVLAVAEWLCYNTIKRQEVGEVERKLIVPDLSGIPEAFQPILSGAPVFDSSCSPEARVLFIDRDDGFYLKSAPAGMLKTEAALTCYFHDKGVAAEVVAFESGEEDYLLTRRVPGEDCTFAAYLDRPEKLCDILGQRLRMLHEMNIEGCPVPDRMESYRALAERNYRTGNYDSSHFPDSFGYESAEEAWSVISRDGHLLKCDTLIHGDYCLPNVMLDNWQFSGFIDLGNGGVGDRHIDLFWGIWSLGFNLKTDRYGDRFLDAYGRDRVEPDLLRIVAAYEVFG